jgi:hypothetical protein
MTEASSVQTSQTSSTSEKELNFRKMEQMYQRKLEEERQARLAAEQRAQELSQSRSAASDDEDDNEPYIDKRRLAKTTTKVKEEIKQETQRETQNAIQKALEDYKRQQWLDQNPDYEEVLSHADKLAETDPELARSILAMPDSFERNKLVYRNIKLLGAHKPKQPSESIQQTIDKNLKNPLQPFGVGSPGYSIANGGFKPSAEQGKDLYRKMVELRSNLRI